MIRFLDILVAASVIGIAIWIPVRLLRRSPDPVDLLRRWTFSALLLGGTFWITARMFGVGRGSVGNAGMAAGYGLAFVIAGLAATCGILLAILWAPHIASFIAGFVTDAFDGGSADETPPPLYAIAIAHRKMGRYTEAIAEIRKQLAQHPGDFQGCLLLAEIHADELKDFSPAEEAIRATLSNPETSPANASFVLNRLADWELKLNDNPVGAASALKRIAEIFPESEAAHFANQRLSHLLGTTAELHQKAARSPIHLEHHEENIGLMEGFKGIQIATVPPAESVRQCLNHLEKHPDDYETRERLASLYAQEFQRADLASQELERLIATPHQPEKFIVRWLNMIADMHIKISGDESAARSALERIIERCPNLAAAENARNRLARIKLELNARRDNRVVRPGSSALA